MKDANKPRFFLNVRRAACIFAVMQSIHCCRVTFVVEAGPPWSLKARNIILRFGASKKKQVDELIKLSKKQEFFDEVKMLEIKKIIDFLSKKFKTTDQL